MFLLGIELKANSAWGKNLSHCLGWVPANNLSKFPKFQLTTSVCPCGWQVVLKFKDVSSLTHNSFQKLNRNLVSLSEVIYLETPCSLTTSLKNRFATWLASCVFLRAMKWIILENISTTTNMASNPLCVLGSPVMKSMEISNPRYLWDWQCHIKSSILRGSFTLLT